MDTSDDDIKLVSLSESGQTDLEYSSASSVSVSPSQPQRPVCFVCKSCKTDQYSQARDANRLGGIAEPTRPAELTLDEITGQCFCPLMLINGVGRQRAPLSMVFRDR